MIELLKKYAGGNLSPEETAELRRIVNSCREDEIAGMLEELWNAETEEPVPDDTQDKLRFIKQDMDAKLLPSGFRKRRYLSRIAVAAAASVAVLILILNVFHLRQIPQSDMTVRAGAGQKADVVLPDGTQIRLNSETTLVYNGARFNRKSRSVSLEGEAWFDVAQNKLPFTIRTSHLRVEVLGTSFNLSARADEQTEVVDLIRGTVRLKAAGGSGDIMLYSDRRAVLDKKMGVITISGSGIDYDMAWLRDELVFHAVPMGRILRELERCYGVKIETDAQNDMMGDLFTGTFSAKDLRGTLAMLALHYGFTYVIDGDTVYMRGFGTGTPSSRRPAADGNDVTM